jgi:hypothetical protein
MKTPYGHLTYCTNIHAGEQWTEHFDALRQHVPVIKKNCSPAEPMGIGLRLSNAASLELEGKQLDIFQDWLRENDCYVFTMNGFPYGGFHHTRVKDQVHAPDWTNNDRLDYTLRLFRILSILLPAGMDGGISTSPLSYRHWRYDEEVFKITTGHIVRVAEELVKIKARTGQVLHLDIEPEPDGLLESGPEFIKWYSKHLIPAGILHLGKVFGFNESRAVEALHDHIRLCYDICHFAVGYEHHRGVIDELRRQEILVGKIQISSALKAAMPDEYEKREAVKAALEVFNESTYLHQVVALRNDGTLKRYPDLPQALREVHDSNVREWRSHFHVPLFAPGYGVLASTQPDIQEVLNIQQEWPFTQHLEVETYTWEVLPPQLKLPLAESIVRELQWVQEIMLAKHV